jgi:hypothetical protein
MMITVAVPGWQYILVRGLNALAGWQRMNEAPVTYLL